MIQNDNATEGVHDLASWREKRLSAAPDWTGIATSDLPLITNRAYTGDMNDITRDELRNTLSAIEERMDSRIQRIEQSENRRHDDYQKEMAIRDDQIRREIDLRHDAFKSEQAIRDRALDERFSGFLAAQTERDRRIDGSLTTLSDTQKEIKASIGSMRTTIIVTAVTTVLAIVIGVVSFNAMLTSNMISAFQMGRSEQSYQKNQESQAAPPPPAKSN